MIGKITKDRKSVFKELGLDTDQPTQHHLSSEKEFGEITGLASPTTPISALDRQSTSWSNERASEQAESPTGNRAEGQDGQGPRPSETDHQTSPTSPSSSSKPWYARLTPGRRPRIRSAASAPAPTMNSLTRLSAIALLIAVVLPGFSYFNGRDKVSLNGADAGVIPTDDPLHPVLETRADSRTKVCRRWAQQAAQLNGTLYVCGGRSSTSEGQDTNTWNNDFLTLDLTKSWKASSPRLRGLPKPSGPPAVALGYLWNDYNNLYLYGGQFSDKPWAEPEPESTWKYDIKAERWVEYKDQRTSSGNHSDRDNVPVQRSAEGAGLSVPELGLSWYFGGHLDRHTTPGWSIHTPRVYLKSLLEFTHPGYTNDGVESLASGTGAGEEGVYRNITKGGLQTNDDFFERADGVLVFVPGWGDMGVLIGLAGGTAEDFTDDLEVLDVYDIARSEWYHQKTTGETPSVRVNLCAVVASAPDASSFQVYVYGGQNLQPYMEQVQYSDMYILSIPAFTWVKAPQSGSDSHTPSARAGDRKSVV